MILRPHLPSQYGKLIHRIDDQPFRIELRQKTRKSFTVIYGLHVDEGLDYAGAAAKLGEAIMLSLSCEGKLDGI